MGNSTLSTGKVGRFEADTMLTTGVVISWPTVDNGPTDVGRLTVDADPDGTMMEEDGPLDTTGNAPIDVKLTLATRVMIGIASL